MSSPDAQADGRAAHASPPRPSAYRPWRLVLAALAVLAVMALGIVAGRWQWGRHETRSEALAAQEAAQGAAVVPLGSLVSPSDADAGAAEWRVVTVTGTIDEDSITAIRGRRVEGVATLQYVAWVDTPDGASVAVNLGWEARDGFPDVPADDPDFVMSGDPGPRLPAGEVTVTGIARGLEPDNGKPGTRIALAQLPAPAGEPLPAYVMAQTACGGAGCVERVAPVPEPTLSLGPHLSYAFQWWLLAAAAAPVAVLLVRRDARLEAEQRDAEASGARAGEERAAAAPRRRRKERGPTDEEIEDAL